MNPSSDNDICVQMERVALHALRALPADEISAAEAHLSTCEECRNEFEQLRPIVDYFVDWPIDIVNPPAGMSERLAQSLSAETGRKVLLPTSRTFAEPDWEQVSPGISVKLLSRDEERKRVSMLVRLAQGVEYPPHTHASVEELHLLDGELWIDDRKLRAGDFNRAEHGTSDSRVWSETGCTCVLITSADDVLR